MMQMFIIKSLQSSDEFIHTKFMLSKSLNKIIKSEMQTACCLFILQKKKTNSQTNSEKENWIWNIFLVPNK